MAETARVRFVPEVVWVVYDGGNDRPLCACTTKDEAEALEAIYDDQWISVRKVPVVCLTGMWEKADEEVANG